MEHSTLLCDCHEQLFDHNTYTHTPSSWWNLSSTLPRPIFIFIEGVWGKQRERIQWAQHVRDYVRLVRLQITTLAVVHMATSAQQRVICSRLFLITAKKNKKCDRRALRAGAISIFLSIQHASSTISQTMRKMSKQSFMLTVLYFALTSSSLTDLLSFSTHSRQIWISHRSSTKIIRFSKWDKVYFTIQKRNEWLKEEEIEFNGENSSICQNIFKKNEFSSRCKMKWTIISSSVRAAWKVSTNNNNTLFVGWVSNCRIDPEIEVEIDWFRRLFALEAIDIWPIFSLTQHRDE